MIVGNDISEFQGQIDFNTYKNNANFCIIKSSYGNGYTDKEFARNLQEVRRVNLPHGFYHYAYPQYNKSEDEAAWFLKTLEQLTEGEVLCLDYEEHFNGDGVAWCKAFLEYVYAKTGVKPLLYLNQSQVTGYNWKPIVDSGYGLWIAAYTYDPKNNLFVTGKWQEAALQQWTDKQTVPGIKGNVDGDVFFGDVTAFQKYGYHATAESTTPDPCADLREQVLKLTKENMKLKQGLPVTNATDITVPQDLQQNNAFKQAVINLLSFLQLGVGTKQT